MDHLPEDLWPMHEHLNSLQLILNHIPHTGIHVQAAPRSGKTTLAQVWMFERILLWYRRPNNHPIRTLWVSGSSTLAAAQFKPVYKSLPPEVQKRMVFECVGITQGLCSYTPTIVVLDDVFAGGSGNSRVIRKSVWNWLRCSLAVRMDMHHCNVLSLSSHSEQGPLVMNGLKSCAAYSTIPWMHLNMCNSRTMDISEDRYVVQKQVGQEAYAELYEGSPVYLLGKGC